MINQNYILLIVNDFLQKFKLLNVKVNGAYFDVRRMIQGGIFGFIKIIIGLKWWRRN